MLEPVKYVIVTPVKNEEKFIRGAIESVLQQTLLPNEWVIVNDGSIDNSASIVTEYTKRFPWLRLINLPTSTRSRGGHVVKVFLEGLCAVKNTEYDFLVKLDADLSFQPQFFQRAFQYFVDTPKLGITSGISYTHEGDDLREEKGAKGHTLGACKIYKRQCYDEIGGLIPNMGWDGIDEIKARMMGWIAEPVPELMVVHHRPEGHAQGLYKSGIERGAGSYYMGYHPLFFVARAVRYMLRPRSFLDGLGMLAGYSRSVLKREQRIADEKLVHYIRKNQIRKLLMQRSEL